MYEPSYECAIDLVDVKAPNTEMSCPEPGCDVRTRLCVDGIIQAKGSCKKLRVVDAVAANYSYAPREEAGILL